MHTDEFKMASLLFFMAWLFLAVCGGTIFPKNDFFRHGYGHGWSSMSDCQSSLIFAVFLFVIIVELLG